MAVVYEEEASASEREAALEDVEGVQFSDEAKFESGDAVSVEISEGLIVETAAEIVAEDPAVKYAIPNYYVSILDEPAVSTRGASLFKIDDYQTTQWYLDYIKAPATWSIMASKGGNLEPAKVAVIDTGGISFSSGLGECRQSRTERRGVLRRRDGIRLQVRTAFARGRIRQRKRIARKVLQPRYPCVGNHCR